MNAQLQQQPREGRLPQDLLLGTGVGMKNDLQAWEEQTICSYGLGRLGMGSGCCLTGVRTDGTELPPQFLALPSISQCLPLVFPRLW